MYITAKNCFLLDEIVKAFEVAYRSYVARVLIDRYPSEGDFFNGVNELNGSVNPSTVITSIKYKKKLESIKQNKKEIYHAILYCNQCTINSDYEKEKVLYVSQVLDFTFFYFNPNFKILCTGFATIEQFLYLSTLYHSSRNNLSHPASTKISNEDTRQVINYIKTVIENIDNCFFWYVSKNEILHNILSLQKNLINSPIKIHNLDSIVLSHRKLLYRDDELNLLRDYIAGKQGYYRRSGSVVLYGYGGIGKTALIYEFLLRLIKDVNDSSISTQFDFIIFFSNKEEILKYHETTGRLYINPIRKRVNTFDEYKNRLFKYLDILDWDSFVRKDLHGVVVIDNFETFDEQDKTKILESIRTSPDGIQYILTSRNEEKCDDKIYLQEFNENNKGLQFIDEYINENNLDVELSLSEKSGLLNGTKGNTLILVLALERIHSKRMTIKSIIVELNNIANQNATIIAEFMYKNTFDQTIKELESKQLNPLEVLKVISLYDEPIDLFSISTISGLKINEVEHICNFLSTKLILVKTQELFTLNEFANKFVFIKFIPNQVELEELKQKIQLHKTSINKNLETLAQRKIKFQLLKNIMDDWKPLNYVDQIAISEAYNLFGMVRKMIATSDKATLRKEVDRINRTFENHEMKTSHPYVRFQKARVFKLFLDAGINTEYIRQVINDCFEKTIYSVQFEYGYIQNTRSYASTLWLYGMFLNWEKDVPKAIKYFEEAKMLFEQLQIYDENYYKMLSELCFCYFNIYNKSFTPGYINSLIKIYFELNGTRNPRLEERLRRIVDTRLTGILCDA